MGYICVCIQVPQEIERSSVKYDMAVRTICGGKVKLKVD